MGKGGSKRVDDDFRLACGFFAHPKTKKLRRALGWEGVIALQKLFAWATTQRTDGNLAGLSDADIEDAIDWPDMGVEGALVPVLVNLRWLDGPEGRRVIHDWLENNPYVATKHVRVARAKKGAAARWGQGELPLDTPPDGGTGEQVEAARAGEECPEHAPSIEADAPSTPGDATSNALEQCPLPHPTQHQEKSESPARAHEASPKVRSAAKALRQAGCQDASETNPILASVLEHIPAPALIDLAREKPGKPLLYLINTYRGRLADAEQAGQAVAGSGGGSVVTSAGQGTSPPRPPEDAQTARAKAEAYWRTLGLTDQPLLEQGATP